MSCIVCLSIYTLFVLIISFIIYYKNQIFYRPLYYINPDTSEKIDVHKLYQEFVVLDHNSFFRIFIAFYIFAIPRFIINVILAVGQILEIKSNMADLKNPTTDPEEWNIMSNTISRWTRWLLWWNSINVNIIKDDKKYLEVYKKYLGDDYEVDSNEKYSLIVSNHLGFYDIVMNMAINKCGFLAKEETKKYCLVSTIAKGINCLFVNRNDKKNREKILTEIKNRQEDFYEGRLLTPLCIFPEGTTTNGKYILKFKRGAFYSLMPIKPQLMTLENNLNYSHAIGVGSAGWNYWRSLCYFGCKVNLHILPVIKPTEFMYETYRGLGNEKWEIFAEVTRKIMCEIGGLEPSDKNFRDSKIYENSLRKGEYETEENKQLLEVRS